MLGLRPDECVGFEDAEAGIEGINGAGMFSVGVGSRDAMKEADYAVESTADLNLKTILEKANQN
jgi:beta-phosphoglucomutase